MSAAETFNDENNALLQNQDDEKKEESPRRNTKAELIGKILDLAEKNGVPIEYSDTKLRRMTKPQLMEIMGDVTEQAVRSQMAAQVGVERGSSDQLIALGALRMIHDICANSAEKGANVFLGKYDYEIDGFAKTLKEPVVSEAVDQCLAEIAAENKDILNYVKSPYARLGLAWAGALTACVRKKQRLSPQRVKDAKPVGPRPPVAKDPHERRASRGPPNGKIVRSI